MRQCCRPWPAAQRSATRSKANLDVGITGVVTRGDLRTRHVDLGTQKAVVLTGLPLTLDELTRQFAHHLRRRAVAGLGLGHEGVAQFRLQLHGEHGFFGHERF